MKLLKLKKRIFACLCGLFMLFGVGGIVALQQSNDTPVAVTADAASEITIATSPWTINNESTRFRVLFNSPISTNEGSAAIPVGQLSDLCGLEDKLLLAGKTPAEWSALDVGFSVAFRSSSQPVLQKKVLNIRIFFVC